MIAAGGAIAMWDATARVAPVKAYDALQEEQRRKSRGPWGKERAHGQMPEAGVVGGGGKYTFNHLCELYWGRSYLIRGPDPAFPYSPPPLEWLYPDDAHAAEATRNLACASLGRDILSCARQDILPSARLNGVYQAPRAEPGPAHRPAHEPLPLLSLEAAWEYQASPHFRKPS